MSLGLTALSALVALLCRLLTAKPLARGSQRSFCRCRAGPSPLQWPGDVVHLLTRTASQRWLPEAIGAGRACKLGLEPFHSFVSVTHVYLYQT